MYLRNEDTHSYSVVDEATFDDPLSTRYLSHAAYIGIQEDESNREMTGTADVARS